MYAGSITGVEGSNFDMFSRFNTAYPAAINVYAVAGAETSRSYINTSMVRLRQNDTNIMVDSAAELIINAQLSNGDMGNHKLIKTGAGKLTLTNGSSDYIGGTEIRGGELLVEADALGTGSVLVASGCLNIVACVVNQGSNTVTIQSGGSLKMTEAELDAAAVSIQGGAQAVLNSSILHDLTVEAGAEVEMTGCTFLGGLSLSLDADYNLSGNDFSNVEQFVFTNVVEGKTIDLSGNSWGTLDRDEILARFGAMAQYVELGEILSPVDSITYVVNSVEASGEGSLAGAITRLNATTGDKTVILDLSGLEDGVSIQLSENLPVITKSCTIIGANTVLVGTLRADGAQIDFRNITLESFAGSNGAGYVLDDESAIATYRIVSDEGIVLGSDSTCDVTESLRSNGGALIESGIWRFNVRQAYEGPTTVCAGATLVLNAATGRNGVVKGTVNVLGTLELAAWDCTGYADDVISVFNLGNEQQGGAILHVSTTGNQTLGSAVVNMYGSSITGITGSNIDLFAGGSRVNVYAVEGGSSESSISGTSVGLRQDDTVFHIDSGAVLTINSLLDDGDGAGNNKLIKTGAGKLVLTNAGNVYSGGTEINAGTLEVTEGASISRGAVTVADGAALLLSAANINLGSNEITVQNGGTLTATEGTSIAAGAVRIEAGATAVLAGVQASHVVIEAGANVTITDASAINKLTISLDAEVSITGNDFSQTQI
ncbi:MAG: autotransporter-associated beta strand repeat-containing protein, partial [Akkermansia sp.]|nr:autotransporter-associated beta strand repeat-containing protein [Akkermansia sp.]